MTCSHCHTPGLFIRLQRIVWPTVRWALVFACHNQACVYEYREFDGPRRLKGRPVFALPVGRWD